MLITIPGVFVWLWETITYCFDSILINAALHMVCSLPYTVSGHSGSGVRVSGGGETTMRLSLHVRQRLFSLVSHLLTRYLRKQIAEMKV